MANTPNLTQPITEKTNERSSRDSRIHLIAHSTIARASAAAKLAWRAGSLIAVLTVLWIACRPEVGFAQNPPEIVTYDGTADGTCYDDCCQTYTVTLNSVKSYVNLYPLGNGADMSCFDESCWVGQSTPGINFVYESGVGFGINTWGYTGSFPCTINFELCAPLDCWENFPRVKAVADDGTTETFPVYLCDGGGLVQDCGTCDRVDAFNNGCWTTACFMHFGSGPLSSFTLHFNPPLSPCNFTNEDPTGKGCNYGWLTGIRMDEPGWTMTPAGEGPPGYYSELVFSGGPMEGCGYQFCIEIPHCPTTQQTTISVTDGYECTPDSGSSLPVPLKQADGGSMGEQTGPEQNYPNPVDASSGFKTTIPFTTSASGVATIRIVDQTGKEVMNDNEEATYAGQHFFYFTASALPSGTYYYQIEFPQGVVIQNKTMLVVK